MSQCTWRQGCTETIADDKTLCSEHIAEAKALRGIKVENWKRAEEQRVAEYFAIGVALREADKAGVHSVLYMFDTTEAINGTAKVVTAVKNKRSKVMNYLSGSTKISRVRVPGWEQGKYSTTLLNEQIDGLSTRAAKIYADEFNVVLSQSGLSNELEAVVVE